MSIYYSFNGQLTFETKEETKKQFELISGNKNGIFWRPLGLLVKGIFLEENTIKIDSNGFCGGETYYDTQSLIRESVSFAKSGKVRCYEGDDENDGSYENIVV